MKTFMSILLIILLTFNVGIAYSQWEQTYEFGNEFTHMDFSFSFSSPQNGWITYTTVISPSSGNSVSLKFTNNFGNSWESGGTGIGVQYPSAVGVYTSGPDTVYWFVNSEWGSHCNFTYNSGNSWESKRFDPESATDAVFLVNRNLLYSTSRKGKLFKHTPDSTYLLMETNTIKFSHSNIFFTDTIVGYITARDTANENVLLTTKNGGNFWEKIELATDLYLNSIYFTSDSIGYIACSDGKILKTTDYGENFTEYSFDVPINLSDIVFINDSCGYCVGSNGSCLYTIDFGNTWLYDENFTDENLYNIQMFTMENGYVFGSLGQQYRFYSKNNMSGLSQEKANLFSVYPNPTNDFINIRTEKSISKICIYNRYGSNILSFDNYDRELNVSQLKPGLYYIRVTTDNNSYTKKVIKK